MSRRAHAVRVQRRRRRSRREVDAASKHQRCPAADASEPARPRRRTRRQLERGVASLARNDRLPRYPRNEIIAATPAASVSSVVRQAASVTRYSSGFAVLDARVRSAPSTRGPWSDRTCGLGQQCVDLVVRRSPLMVFISAVPRHGRFHCRSSSRYPVRRSRVWIASWWRRDVIGRFGLEHDSCRRDVLRADGCLELLGRGGVTDRDHCGRGWVAPVVAVPREVCHPPPDRDV